MITNIHIMNRRPLRSDGNRREGAVLAIVLIVVLLLGVLAVAILKNGELVGVESVWAVRESSAFWAADAGVQHVRALMVLSNDTYRAQTSPWMVTNGTPQYVAHVQQDSVSWTGTGTTYVVVSTGTVQATSILPAAIRVVQERIQIDLAWPDAFNYALYSGGGELLWLRKDTTVEGYMASIGDIYSAAGYKFNTEPPDMIDGSIYDGDPDTGYPPPSGDPPTTPALLNDYHDLTLMAAVAANTSVKFPRSLGGTNTFVNADITITNNIQGPGRLVVSGNVTIDRAITLGSNVEVLAGGHININSSYTNGTNCLFYAAEGIVLDTAAIMNGPGSCALITPKTIDARKALTFYGMMYAGEDINLEKDAYVQGVMVAGQGMTIKMDLTIIYDPDQFPSSMLSIFQPKIEMTGVHWQENVAQ